MTRKTRLESWIDHRRAKGHEGAPILYVNPADNWLSGMKAITNYLGVLDARTVVHWVELYGFPAIKLPTGQWATTMTAIDQWIFIACDIEARIRSPRFLKRRQNRDARIAAAIAERDTDDSDPTLQ